MSQFKDGQTLKSVDGRELEQSYILSNQPTVISSGVSICFLSSFSTSHFYSPNNCEENVCFVSVYQRNVHRDRGPGFSLGMNRLHGKREVRLTGNLGRRSHSAGFRLQSITC